jgi:enoyl-CoA hydratase/carnithine racemase
MDKDKLSGMSSDGLILTSIDTGLVQLTINRPPANALTGALIAALISTLKCLAQLDSPPGVVLTGAGERFFSACGDINEVAGSSVSDIAHGRFPRVVVPARAISETARLRC